MKSLSDLQHMNKWIRICAIILAVLMVRVWEHVQAQRLGRRLAALRQETDKLTYENGRLQTQIHQFIAPSKLEAEAKERKMTPITPAQRIGVQ